MRPMQLAADYEHRYAASNGFEARARVRLFEPRPEEREAGPVVILSEPPASYDGPSVTNNVGQLAAEVVMRFALPSSQTVFIEHYPPEAGPFGDRETFDLVTFDVEEPTLRPAWPGRWVLALGGPSWQRVERADVEELLGRPIEDRR